MTTLTEKIDELQLQMSAQHLEVLEALEAITLAVGGTPTTGATLADVVAAITAQTLVLSDVHLDTISIDQKLLLVRDNVLGILVNGNDTKTLLGFIEDHTNDIQETIGLKEPGPDSTISFLVGASNLALQNVVTSLGMLPMPAQGTVLDLLGDLRAIQSDCCGDKGPTQAECDDPFKSGAMVTLPWALIGGSSQTFAVFDGIIPPTLDYGTIFGLGVDETELVSADWSQWWVFVQSDQPQYSDGSDGFTRKPTGVWDLMSGSGSRAFAVDARGALQVTLCPIGSYNPGGVPPVEPTVQCEFANAIQTYAAVLGGNASRTDANFQGGVFWMLGNDVDNGSVELSVDGTVIVTQALVGAYASYPLGRIPSGTITARHIGPGNTDFRLHRCPDDPT